MTGRIGTVVAAAALATTGAGVAHATGDAGPAAMSPAARACTAAIPQPALGGLAGLPLAPEGRRADLCMPAFSHPTRVTNPLLPIARLRSALLLGRVDGRPFRTETTLLPHTTTIEWGGRRFQALESQYVAFLGGRLDEVAIDRYAQADDGSVWYLGEDVVNYDNGVVADTEGTWEAGRTGPGAMIMPARPGVGDAFRPENAPGVVFEEVTVTAVGRTVAGPHGPVAGAIVTRELHRDGSTEGKVFAPGYGEFRTGSGGDLEAVALAVPADALPGPPPPALRALSDGADAVFAAAGSGDWTAASARVAAMRHAWRGLRRTRVPAMVGAEMSRVLGGLSAAVGARHRRRARHLSIEVARTGLDLELRHRPAAQIDRARFDLWARQVAVDAAAGDRASVRGGVTTLTWIRDRFAHTVPAARARSIDARLRHLAAAAEAGEFAVVAEAASRLRATPGRP